MATTRYVDYGRFEYQKRSKSLMEHPNARYIQNSEACMPTCEGKALNKEGNVIRGEFKPNGMYVVSNGERTHYFAEYRHELEGQRCYHVKDCGDLSQSENVSEANRQNPQKVVECTRGEINQKISCDVHEHAMERTRSREPEMTR